MRRRSICRCCHRFRVVDDTRCCPICAENLMAISAPKRVSEEVKADEVVQAIATPEEQQ